MIGIKGILFDMFPFIPLVLFGLIVARIMRSGKWWKDATSVCVSLLFAVFALMFLGGIFVGLWSLRTFESLRANEVARVTVGDKIISDEACIASIVDTLHECKYFSSSHGGWADEIRFDITMKDGKKDSFLVALYLRRPGAVLRKRIGNSRAYTTFDCAFTEELPAVLTGLGAELPQARAGRE